MANMIDRDATIKEICDRTCHGHSGCSVDCDEVSAVRNMPFVTDDAAYQRGYEDGFREGRTRKELVEAKDAVLPAE